MNRSLKSLVLVLSLSFAWVHVAFADEATDTETTTGADAEEASTTTETIDEPMSLPVCPLDRGASSGTCGAPNGAGVLNEGDCIEDSMLVTEVTEPIGDSVELGDSKIIDVYHGVCCAEVNGSTCVQEEFVYFSSFTQCDSALGGEFCEPRQWIIASSGAGIIKIYIKQIYIYGSGIVGFIAVTVIILSAIQISFSGASGDVSASKDRIIQSIVGLVLLFLSGLILYTVNPNFFS